MEPIIEVEELRKTYGNTRAVDGISFSVQAGEIFGMVGPNGAGKTTTIECLEGLRKPDGGELRVMGVDPYGGRKLLQHRVGIQLQQSNLPERIKVWEALDLYGTFYPKPVDWRFLLDRLGLADKSNISFSKLSGGQKQRLFIALALLPDPQLIFLDELTTGLDPQARHAIWDLVRDLRADGKTVFLTTHFMEEAERLCDRVAILDHGHIAALDKPAILIRNLGEGERVIFNITGELPDHFDRAFDSAVRVENFDGRVTVSALGGRQAPLVSEVVNVLSKEGVVFSDLRTEQPNLEDVFLKLTGHEMKA
mgnify:CR=1 FL=1